MSRILNMLQEVEPGYHPLVSILKIARSPEAREDLRLQMDCHSKIAKYVEAERRSIDVKTEDGAELVKLNIKID
jgi:hypothetical protein